MHGGPPPTATNGCRATAHGGSTLPEYHINKSVINNVVVRARKWVRRIGRSVPDLHEPSQPPYGDSRNLLPTNRKRGSSRRCRGRPTLCLDQGPKLPPAKPPCPRRTAIGLPCLPTLGAVESGAQCVDARHRARVALTAVPILPYRPTPFSAKPTKFGLRYPRRNPTASRERFRLADAAGGLSD